RRVAQGVPLLKEMDTQHGRQRVGLTASPARSWVMRFDQRQQPLPRHNLIHLIQEQLPARLLALAQTFGISECQLHEGSFNVSLMDLKRARQRPNLPSDLACSVQTFLKLSVAG